MFNLISETTMGNWVVWVIFGVMIVGMILLTVLPNKKRQKEYQQMQDNLRVGTKVMTIGRLIGVITKVYSDGTIELDVGTPGAPVVITINREAIAVNLTAQAQAAAQKAAAANQPKAEAKAEEVVEAKEGEETSEAATEEVKEVKKDQDDAI
ncbi:MAG: preprotein translocase subunit YajC [Clostridia bacterium]|nr:preprotein translocase subunit YajC [Clostridia bacterium]